MMIKVYYSYYARVPFGKIRVVNWTQDMGSLRINRTLELGDV